MLLVRAFLVLFIEDFLVLSGVVWDPGVQFFSENVHLT